MTTVLELRGITKSFPGVLANDHIDLTLEQGEIHALLGENGAGKTTLMNILYGLYKPDEGEILVHGAEGGYPRRQTTPSPAASAWCTSTSCSCPVMTVTENVMLGVEPTRNGIFLDEGQGGQAHPRDLRAVRPGRRPRLPTSRTCRSASSSASRSSRCSTARPIS